MPIGKRSPILSARMRLFLLSLLFLPFKFFAQVSDTTVQANDRISDFRDNVIDYMGQDLLDADFPNSWPIFGTKARMSIGGYAKLDYIQDFNGIYDRFQVTINNIQVPGDGRPEQSGYMNMFARESRLNLDFRTVTKNNIPIRIFFELDFYNLDRAPFGQTPRLRHAYGVYGRLLIGRSWGTLTDTYAIPVTIDFGVGDAVTGTRRAVVRWEDKVNEKINYAVGLEMLEYSGIDPAGQSGQASPNLPLLAGRLTRMTASGGRLFIGGQIYQLRWDPDGPDKPTTSFAWGINFSGREYVGTKKHFFHWQVTYGDGFGSNVLTLLGDGSAVVRPDNTLETMETLNMGGGFNYNITPNLAANINASYFYLDPSDLRDDNNIKSGATGHINLIWAPLDHVNVGMEYIYGRRTNVDDNYGNANRLQAMIKYKIN